MARLRDKYNKDIMPSMTKAFGYKNVMQEPKISKVVVHVTLGEATQNIKVLEAAEKELAVITGQKALVTKSKKAIAGFKLKQDVPLGCKVTLRGERMYEFLDRLISVSLPRIRDFRGLSTKSFDGRGNFSFGLKEQYIFPEIDYDKVELVHGLDVTICTSAKTDEESRALLKEFGMPFRR